MGKKYKDYYNFNEISKEMDKNNFIQFLINNIINNSQTTNFNLNDKLAALIIKQLPKKIINDFNNKDNKFQTNYKNEEIQNPNITQINYNNENNILFYYFDFELISAEIYEFLFKYIGKNVVFNDDTFDTKAEKAMCVFEDKYIIIQFPLALDKKYLIEIGKLNNNNIFEPEYFLLYEQYNNLNEHVQNIIKSKGFKEYCKTFSLVPMNTFDIIDNKNIKIGIAIKKNMNPEYNKNNRNNISNQKYSANIKMDKIKNINIIYIKEGQENKNNIIINYTQSIPKLNTMFPWPPRVGLDKIGETYYMNAILQCFCQIDEFASYFKCDKLHNHVKIFKLKKNYNI